MDCHGHQEVGDQHEPAGALLVVSSTGIDDTGKNRLRVVRIPTSAHGVRMTSSAAPFVPEIERRGWELDHLVVAEATFSRATATTTISSRSAPSGTRTFMRHSPRICSGSRAGATGRDTGRTHARARAGRPCGRDRRAEAPDHARRARRRAGAARGARIAEVEARWSTAATATPDAAAPDAGVDALAPRPPAAQDRGGRARRSSRTRLGTAEALTGCLGAGARLLRSARGRFAIAARSVRAASASSSAACAFALRRRVTAEHARELVLARGAGQLAHVRLGAARRARSSRRGSDGPRTPRSAAGG